MQLALDSQDLSPAEVRRRFHWAKRRGDPAWLWPDVPVAAWREALSGIEDAVRAVLSGRPDAQLQDGDPAAIGLACYTSGTGPLLGYWCEQGLLSASEAVAPALELHLRHNRLRATRMEAAAVSLVEALSERGVAVAVLKGAHTARDYFPDPGARPASDIDLLVRQGEVGSAEAMIAAAGFAFQGRGARESSWRPDSSPAQPRSLTLVHADDPWSVDLHGSLDIFVSAGAPLARLDAARPMDAGSRWGPCRSAMTLDQPLLLLHLAVHAGSGLQNLTLLRLIELNLVIRRDAAVGSLSWDEFLAMGEDTGSLGFAYPALRLSEDLAPGTVPTAVLDRCTRRAPAAVVRIVGRLTPATAQRIDRTSMAQHFMWAVGWKGRMRQLGADLVAPASAWEKRAWRLLRGRFSR